MNKKFPRFYDDTSQLDELESNLKKISHRNGIWGLEANVM